MKIKLCQRGAHTCARPLFRYCNLDINPMTLKLKGDLDILKKVTRLTHSKLLMEDEIGMGNKK